MHLKPRPELPDVIYRSICVYLPPKSALDFLLVSRAIYRACNDWTVWREVIRNDSSFDFNFLEEQLPDRDVWKRYGVAISNAYSARPYGVQDLYWLPQMVALNHPATSSMHIAALPKSCDPIFDALVVTDQSYVFGSNVESPHDLFTWQLAQAAAFCVSARFLFEPSLNRVVTLLECVPWFQSNAISLDNTPDPNTELVTVMQHALANRAIGLFCIQLRYVLDDRRKGSRSTKGLQSPPITAKIPLQSMMNIPRPFSRNALSAFSLCHLRSTTDPTFFTDDTWTGYISAGVYGHKTTFNGIGGINGNLSYQGDIGRCNQTGQFPHGRDFEPVVRYQLVDPYDDEQDNYRLVSNNFYSEGELHRFSIDVQRSTGRLRIAQWHRLKPDFLVSDAVVTPFGILSGLVLKSCWLWLWKTDWSEHGTIN